VLGSLRPRRAHGSFRRLATLAGLALVAWLGWASAEDDAAPAPPVPADARPAPAAVTLDAKPPTVTPAPPIDAAAPIDAAVVIDAGVASDARVPIDAATPIDAAVLIDASTATRAGTVRGARTAIDAGIPLDAGIDLDAGTTTTPGPEDHSSTVKVPPPATEPTPPSVGPPEPAPAHEGNRAAVIIKLVLGFVAIFAISYIGSHKKVVRAQERLGIGGVIAAGFPFVALGVIVRQPQIGILTHDVIERMRPLLHFGLGWLGFIIGAQLDIRLLDRLPRGTAYLVVVEALAPFAVAAAAAGGCAVALGISDWREPTFWRDLILLGAAAAMTAPRRFRGFANRGWREGRGADTLLAQLDEIVGVVGLLFVAAYFRPTGTAGWQIPGTAWLFVTIGLGVVVGILIFTIVRVPVNSGEFLAVVLGSVALGSGLAGYLYLSPIVVCFVAGALVTNFPCEQRDEIFRILNHLERPIHLLFLIVAGAIWNVTELAPWAIVPAFVIARIIGKWIGVFAAAKTVGSAMPKGFADERVLVSPLSPLSIALVLSLHGSVGGAASGWIVTVVIAGAMLTEVAVTFTSPPVPASATQLPAAVFEEAIDAVDDLDEQTGPSYGDPARHDDDDDDDSLPPLAPRPRTKGGGA
jgi:Kef-type K+ transport system membrane component KefB